jgi:hypothetical protein
MKSTVLILYLSKLEFFVRKLAPELSIRLCPGGIQTQIFETITTSPRLHGKERIFNLFFPFHCKDSNWKKLSPEICVISKKKSFFREICWSQFSSSTWKKNFDQVCHEKFCFGPGKVFLRHLSFITFSFFSKVLWQPLKVPSVTRGQFLQQEFNT